MVLNNLVLSCACATVFLGTLYPLFLDAVGGPKLSVGFPFFNRTFAPLMVPVIVAVGIGPDAVVEARRPAGRAATRMGRLYRRGAGGAGGLVPSPMAARSSPCWASDSPPGPASR